MKYTTDIFSIFCLIFFISLGASASDWKVITQGTLDGGLIYEVVRYKDISIRLEVKKDDRVLGELNVSEESSSVVLSPIHLPVGVNYSDILLVCTNSCYFTSLRTRKTDDKTHYLSDNDGDGFPEHQLTKTKSGSIEETVEYQLTPYSNETKKVEQSGAAYPPQGVGSADP